MLLIGSWSCGGGEENGRPGTDAADRDESSTIDAVDDPGAPPADQSEPDVPADVPIVAACLSGTLCASQSDCAGGERCNATLVPLACQKLYSSEAGQSCDPAAGDTLCKTGLFCVATNPPQCLDCKPDCEGKFSTRGGAGLAASWPNRCGRRGVRSWPNRPRWREPPACAVTCCTATRTACGNRSWTDWPCSDSIHLGPEAPAAPTGSNDNLGLRCCSSGSSPRAGLHGHRPRAPRSLTSASGPVPRPERTKSASRTPLSRRPGGRGVGGEGFTNWEGDARMKRFFNTAGPCRPDKHYMVPASARLGDVAHLIEQESYFVVHAPRQTGKTTSLRALARELTEAGRYAALHFSCEAGEAAGDDYGASELTVLDAIERAAGIDLAPGLRPPARGEAAPGQRLGALLTAWAQACPRPLVLVFDEIDALQGQSLLTVLRQLRAGFPSRPGAFPSSVILCGLRDVRDYKAASGGDATRLGTSSPFNVKVESIKLGNFDQPEVQGLLLQHQQESGQSIDPAALARVWELTGGQPWLVNALAREVVEKIGVPASEPFTAAHVDEAKERLILARQTHLDSLVARLMEPRVRRVMAPLMAGETLGGDTFDDDYLYVRDLGLVSSDKPVRVANPIYREVLVRVLANAAEANVTVEPRSFVRADGTLDLDKILVEFAAFWREHGEILAGKMPYHEVAPQLVFMAFLQRVVNGGGYVDREYGVGRGRIDLLVRWPVAGADRSSRPRTWQREALELKVWADGKPDPLKKGLEQLDGYLAGLGLDTGVLVLFDRRAKAVRVERRTKLGSATTPGGRAVTLLRA